jgi:phage host-nuclease inhibitor protein Gam
MGKLKLDSFADADNALRDLGLTQILITRTEGRMNEAIAAIKRRTLEQTAGLRDRNARTEAALEEFWDEAIRTRISWPRSKSWTGVYGVIGRRAGRNSVRFLKGWDAKRALTALVCGFKRFLWNPPPKIDRERILKATAAELAELQQHCGIVVKPGPERFFAEPDLVKLADLAGDEAA